MDVTLVTIRAGLGALYRAVRGSRWRRLSAVMRGLLITAGRGVTHSCKRRFPKIYAKFYNHREGPYLGLLWLNVPTFKTLLRHNAKQMQMQDADEHQQVDYHNVL